MYDKPGTSNISPRSEGDNGREHIIDSGSFLHMMGAKSLTLEDKKTVRTTVALCIILTVNGLVGAKEEAAVFTQDLDIFFCVKLVEDSPTEPS